MRGVQRHPRVVIVGGGIGALEAALATRALAGDRVAIELLAPDAEFVYRAMSVAEPFGYDRALRLPFSHLARTHAIQHRRDKVTAVKPGVHEVELSSGETLAYDALVLALGARAEAWLQGAVSFTGPAAVPAVRQLLERMQAGDVEAVAFAAPEQSWTLPVYELALMTAMWCAENGVIDPQLTIVTPEGRPTEIFGRAASRTVADLLSDRGIDLVTGTRATRLEQGRLVLADDRRVPADAVIALPRLLRTPVPGLPADADGFLEVDENAAVIGVPDVYGVGDMTSQPIKQGGLAAQQADAAAAAIAAAFGAPVEPMPFRSVLRGLLLSGVGVAYLRRDAEGTSEAAFDALWWPPTKVAGRFLGPYLTDLHAVGNAAALIDRAAPADISRAAQDREEIRRIAVEFAEAEARWGDHRSALRWLQTVEWLDGVLTEDLVVLRDSWQQELAHS